MQKLVSLLTWNADTNAGAGAKKISSTRDAGGIGVAENNFNSKNTYAKASFSTYNVVGINADADADANAGNTNSTRDSGGTGGTNNNADGKNTYVKTNFNTENVAGANADTYASDTNIIDKQVGNNTNKTNIG